MKVPSIKTPIGFKGGLNNKYLLKGLETIAEHPASFIAGTTLFMSAVVRPINIFLTPKTDKENKKYAAMDSVSSGLVKFAITEAVALPIENAMKTIGKNPQKFLTQKTVSNLKESGKTLAQSQNYKFTEQLIKLSAGFLTAIPKSIIGVALIPVFMNLFKNNKNSKNNNKIKEQLPNNNDKIFAPFTNHEKKASDKNLSFKGLSNITAKSISKIINSNTLQTFVKKFSYNEANIARDLTFATDITLASSYVLNTKHSKKIKEEKKNPLIYNKLISTGLSVVLGYQIDKTVQKNTKNFIDKFKSANMNNPKLSKYIQGINVLRPTLIFAMIYYGIIPVISTFTADKLNKLHNKKTN